MKTLIWVHSMASTGESVRHWLADFDAEAYKGRGVATFTDIKENAKRFDDKGAAFDYWRQVSKRRPRREDGKPNRPLTAYSIEILPEDEDPF